MTNNPFDQLSVSVTRKELELKPIDFLLAEHEKKYNQYLIAQKEHDEAVEKARETGSRWPDLIKPVYSPIEYSDFINCAVGCPSRFETASPDDLPESIWEWTRRFDGKTGLFLYGPAGTGKTHILYALAKFLRLNRYRIRVKNLPEWLNEMRRSFQTNEKDESQAEEIPLDSLYMIDDFLAEKQTEWTLDIIYRIVNKLYENTVLTIFSSNFSIEELGKQYGDRICSRLVEMIGGEAGIIKIDGPDRRLV